MRHGNGLGGNEVCFDFLAACFSPMHHAQETRDPQACDSMTLPLSTGVKTLSSLPHIYLNRHIMRLTCHGLHGKIACLFLKLYILLKVDSFYYLSLFCQLENDVGVVADKILISRVVAMHTQSLLS
jgi:hypothetical protein